MAKTNALIVRYKVFITDAATNVKEVKSITKVGGFSLGEEGTITVPEWDRDAMIADGKRKLKEVTMQYRLMAGLDDHRYFLSWWKARAGDNRDISVVWYDRAWTELFRWNWEDVEFAAFNGEDQELGSVKLGLIDVKFLPYEVDIA